MNTDTPETDVAWNCFKGYIEPLQDVKDLSRKLERERDQWRNEHDRVVREYQHRLVVIGISVIDAAHYPESAIGDGSPDTNTKPMDQ